MGTKEGTLLRKPFRGEMSCGQDLAKEGLPGSWHSKEKGSKKGWFWCIWKWEGMLDFDDWRTE